MTLNNMEVYSLGENEFTTDYKVVLDLGEQPWGNDFLLEEQVGKESFYPLKLIYCNKPQLLQLSYFVPKEVMFSNHTYLSGMTKSLQSHFYNTAKENLEDLNLSFDDVIVDIGGNDGTQLLQYKKLGFNGEVDWSDEDSFLREKFNPKFINSTTEDAFYNFFVKRDLKIDYLHIDADHTYEGCQLDFDLYSTIMNENGIISIHDTDSEYWDSFQTYEGEPHDICTGPSRVVSDLSFRLQVKDEWEVFNLFDHKEKSDKVTSSGLTLLRRKDEV